MSGLHRFSDYSGFGLGLLYKCYQQYEFVYNNLHNYRVLHFVQKNYHHFNNKWKERLIIVFKTSNRKTI